MTGFWATLQQLKKINMSLSLYISSLSLLPSVYLSLSLCVYIYLPPSLSWSLSLCLFHSFSIHLFRNISFVSVYPILYLLYLSISLSPSLSIIVFFLGLSKDLSLSLFLSFSVCHFTYLSNSLVYRFFKRLKTIIGFQTIFFFFFQSLQWSGFQTNWSQSYQTFYLCHWLTDKIG